MRDASTKDRHRELLSALTEIPIDGSISLERIVRRLGDRFEMSVPAIYRPVPKGETLALEFFESPLEPARRAVWEQALGQLGGAVVTYDPIRPQKNQSNRALLLRTLPTRHGERTFRQMGLGGQEQLRVLVCDAGLLLSWVGGFREKPYDERDVRAFDSLVPAFIRVLTLDRKLRDAAVARAGLATALEHMEVPAFITGRWGAIDHANTMGRRLVEREPCEMQRRLADAIEARERGAPTGTTEVARMTGAGVPERWLVIFAGAAGNADACIRAAGSAWKLTRRQAEVLARIARGDSNKTIGHRLGCAEVTVELHATAIYRKARVDGRTALIAKLLEWRT